MGKLKKSSRRVVNSSRPIPEPFGADSMSPLERSEQRLSALLLQMTGLDNAYIELFEQAMDYMPEDSKRKFAQDREVRRLQKVVNDFRTGANGGVLGFEAFARPAFDVGSVALAC